MNDIDQLFDKLTDLQQNKKLPPVHLWHPDYEGTIDIRIDHDGQWFHEGTRFERQSLINLFAGILRKEAEAYFLVTPGEKLRIEVVDVPFMAIDMDVRGQGVDTELLFTSNVDDYFIAGQEHPISMRDERPYIVVRDNLTARITRNVYYRLVDCGVEEKGALYVYSQGSRFCLGSLQ